MSASLTRAFSALAVALATLGTSVAVQAATSPGDVEAGKQIAFSRKDGNCVACHVLPGAKMAGNVGPPLGPWVKQAFQSKDEMVKYLYDPQARFPHTVMPPFGRNKMLTEKQLQQVTDYLWSLTEKGERK